LNCTVQGYPSPHVWWSTNVTSLDQNRITNTTTVNMLTGKTITTAVLEIKSLKFTDFGLYTCHAIEGNHTEKSDTVLKIACKFITFTLRWLFLMKVFEKLYEKHVHKISKLFSPDLYQFFEFRISSKKCFFFIWCKVNKTKTNLKIKINKRYGAVLT